MYTFFDKKIKECVNNEVLTVRRDLEVGTEETKSFVEDPCED